MIDVTYLKPWRIKEGQICTSILDFRIKDTTKSRCFSASDVRRLARNAFLPKTFSSVASQSGFSNRPPRIYRVPVGLYGNAWSQYLVVWCRVFILIHYFSLSSDVYSYFFFSIFWHVSFWFVYVKQIDKTVDMAKVHIQYIHHIYLNHIFKKEEGVIQKMQRKFRYAIAYQV